MGVPISIRLDDHIREELEIQAKLRRIGLSTLLRDLVTEAAREAKRARIRLASAEIGAQMGRSSDAQAFYQDWGTPNADVE
jgi:predicted transcriptional regulator